MLGEERDGGWPDTCMGGVLFLPEKSHCSATTARSPGDWLPQMPRDTRDPEKVRASSQATPQPRVSPKGFSTFPAEGQVAGVGKAWPAWPWHSAP